MPYFHQDGLFIPIVDSNGGVALFNYSASQVIALPKDVNKVSYCPMQVSGNHMIRLGKNDGTKQLAKINGVRVEILDVSLDPNHYVIQEQLPNGSEALFDCYNDNGKVQAVLLFTANKYIAKTNCEPSSSQVNLSDNGASYLGFGLFEFSGSDGKHYVLDLVTGKTRPLSHEVDVEKGLLNGPDSVLYGVLPDLQQDGALKKVVDLTTGKEYPVKGDEYYELEKIAEVLVARVKVRGLSRFYDIIAQEYVVKGMEANERRIGGSEFLVLTPPDKKDIHYLYNVKTKQTIYLDGFRPSEVMGTASIKGEEYLLLRGNGNSSSVHSYMLLELTGRDIIFRELFEARIYTRNGENFLFAQVDKTGANGPVVAGEVSLEALTRFLKQNISK